MHWSLRCGFRADLGVTVQDSKSGAAAAGRVDVVTGAGGARYPGPTGPDPGGGERLAALWHLMEQKMFSSFTVALQICTDGQEKRIISDGLLFSFDRILITFEEVYSLFHRI